MAEKLEDSLVRILNKNGSYIGIGVLISHEHLITCSHVILDALGLKHTSLDVPKESVYVDFPYQKKQTLLSAKVVEESWRPPQKDISNYLDDGEDIAILRLDGIAPKTAGPAQFVQLEELEDHEIDFFGVPANNPQGVWTSGKVVKKLPNGRLQIQGTGQEGYSVEPGFSGSPILDKNQQAVIGIVVARDPKRPTARVGFAIPTDMLVRAWPALMERAILPCPYQGLSTFLEKDARFFFGRNQLIERLSQTVKTQSFTAVVGPSGSGKSSIIFAGLLPKIRLSREWAVESFRPGAFPFRNLAASLVRLLEPTLSETDQLSERAKQAEYLSTGIVKVQDIIERLIEKNPNQQILLIIDQFEELYTLCQDLEKRQNFTEQILQAATQTVGCRIVISLRADFMGLALADPTLAEALQSDIKVGPMSVAGLREAITQPAEMLGVTFDDGLVELMLSSVAKEPGSLPLLEFTLEQLWAKQKNNAITFDAYRDPQIGSVETALVNYADSVYNNLNEEEQRQLQDIFVQLVQPGKGTEDTRCQETREELGETNWDLISRRGGLADKRLVVTGRNASDQDVVEVVHEALIQKWKPLQDWMEKARSFRVWQEQFRFNFDQWKNSNQDSGFLLRGNSLIEAHKWYKQYPTKFKSRQEKFIRKSQQRQRITRYGFWGISVLLALSAVLYQKQTAINQFQRDFSKVFLEGEAMPKYLYILPEALKAAKRESSNTLDGAIIQYRSILTVIQNFLDPRNVRDSGLTNKQIEDINIYRENAEAAVTKIVTENYLSALEKDLANGVIGKKVDGVEPSDFENLYTEGALKTTYSILMRTPGVGADTNENGHLDSQEAYLLPCDLLKEIERLWRQNTEQLCGFYEANSNYLSECDSLYSYTLLDSLFPRATSEDAVNRIRMECATGGLIDEE